MSDGFNEPIVKKSLLIIQAFDTQHPQDMVLIPAGEFEMGTDAIQIPELLQSEKQYFPDAEASWFKNEPPGTKAAWMRSILQCPIQEAYGQNRISSTFILEHIQFRPQSSCGWHQLA